MTLQLLLGGQKSGKSRTAASMLQSSLSVHVIAPAVARDGEFARRIARHRADRPDTWTTHETVAIGSTLAGLDDNAGVLIDALDTWLLERMEAGADDETVLGEVATIATLAARRPGPVVLIAGQPGLGLVGPTSLTRHYVDLHGLSCTVLAEHAEHVWLVVAGRLVPALRPEELP